MFIVKIDDKYFKYNKKNSYLVDSIDEATYYKTEKEALKIARKYFGEVIGSK